MILLPPIPGQSFEKASSYADLAATWPPPGVTLEQVGESEDEQPIYTMTVGDPTVKPTVMFVGGIHGGHEWPCPHYVEHFMTLLGAPDGPNRVLLEKIRAHLAVVAIPCANPYGYDNDDYLNANGVNLNRNFDYMWDEYDDSGAPGTKGTAPFSESETQAVRDVFQAHNPVMFVDIHTMNAPTTGARVEMSEVRDYTLLRDYIKSLAVAGGLAIEEGTTLGQPMGRWWAAKQPPPSPRRAVVSFTIEPGAGEALEDMDRWAVNAMLHACLYALVNFRVRAQVVTPDHLDAL